MLWAAYARGVTAFGTVATPPQVMLAVLKGETIMKCAFCVVLAALMLTVSSGFASNFLEGDRARDRGDYETAISSWQSSVKHGDSMAVWSALSLGNLYIAGDGVEQDYTEGARWWLKSAELGHHTAQVGIADMYYEGRGVTQSYADAAFWYRKAAARKQLSAQNRLGRMYETGRGVKKDLIAAHMWYNISASAVDRYYFNRDRVASNMSSADITEAQRRARVCLESGYKDCNSQQGLWPNIKRWWPW